MEIIYLLIGIVAGSAIGYLTAARKSAALGSREQALREQATTQERLTTERLAEQERGFTARLAEQERLFNNRLADQERQWTERLKEQTQDAQALHQRMNAEFENLSNRIFERKSEDFTRLNADRLGLLLQPLGDNLKAFRQQVAEVYDKESRERLLLDERIKELVILNNRISEDANNLTRALKGDAKMQGNWGEMILERILEASGLIEGEHYFRQEFLKDEQGTALLNEESGQKMQPDILIKYPDHREMIIDSKVSLTAFAAYTATDDRQEQARQLKAHIQSIRTHIDELSAKDYSHYDDNAPDFVMMFIPTESAYLLAIQTEANLWEYAYRKKVVLMSPTNLISALRLSLDLWKRENQVKNVQEVIKRGTLLYEKIVGFSETFLHMGDTLGSAQRDYEKALNQLSQGNGSVVRQAEQLRGMSLTPKKRIPSRLLPKEEETEPE
ncbi:MAG: DNA recombination protein RmuC [Prevotellaceae bacterium]|jgi:DNA recombination protein RmuC|nr:DNA recombination protein RmuC [Prevotellaceae bacterium]